MSALGMCTGAEGMEEDVHSVAVSVERMELDGEKVMKPQQQQHSPKLRGAELDSVRSLRQLGIGAQKPAKRPRNGEARASLLRFVPTPGGLYPT